MVAALPKNGNSFAMFSHSFDDLMGSQPLLQECPRSAIAYAGSVPGTHGVLCIEGIKSSGTLQAQMDFKSVVKIFQSKLGLKNTVSCTSIPSCTLQPGVIS